MAEMVTPRPGVAQGGARWHESEEYGSRAGVLDWAQERPMVAVCMVLLVWMAFIVALTTVYGLFL
jgi:hypothetical protein